MTEIQDEQKKAARGNDKPGGGSQVPVRQQGRKIPGDDGGADADIERGKPERKA
jgi:hypothetical protein